MKKKRSKNNLYNINGILYKCTGSIEDKSNLESLVYSGIPDNLHKITVPTSLLSKYKYKFSLPNTFFGKLKVGTVVTMPNGEDFTVKGFTLWSDNGETVIDGVMFDKPLPKRESHICIYAYDNCEVFNAPISRWLDVELLTESTIEWFFQW